MGQSATAILHRFGNTRTWIYTNCGVTCPITLKPVFQKPLRHFFFVAQLCMYIIKCSGDRRSSYALRQRGRAGEASKDRNGTKCNHKPKQQQHGCTELWGSNYSQGSSSGNLRTTKQGHATIQSKGEWVALLCSALEDTLQIPPNLQSKENYVANATQNR